MRSRGERKILITGSQGMLATDCAQVAAAAGYRVVGYSHHQLDITDIAQMRQCLETERPAVVLNTPGLLVDYCEQHPEEGSRLHAWAPQQMAHVCERLGAVFIYISTCGLFGDEVKLWSEDDAVVLKTQYARSKYLGEQAVLAACSRALVIRPGWLFGGLPSHRKNFVYQRYLEAQETRVLRSVNDKYGSPTYTEDLALKLLELLETETYGTYHVTNAGGGSRYEYVKCIVEAFGLKTVVEPVDSSNFPRSAPVPACEQLENRNLRFAGLQLLGSWQEAIHRYVAHQLKVGVSSWT